MELNARSPNTRVTREAPRERAVNADMDTELAAVLARRKIATPGRDAAEKADELAEAFSKRQIIY